MLTLINTYAIKMAAIFIFSTTTIGMRTDSSPLARHRRFHRRSGPTVRFQHQFVDEPCPADLGLVLSIDILIKGGKTSEQRT